MIERQTFHNVTFKCSMLLCSTNESSLFLSRFKLFVPNSVLILLINNSGILVSSHLLLHQTFRPGVLIAVLTQHPRYSARTPNRNRQSLFQYFVKLKLDSTMQILDLKLKMNLETVYSFRKSICLPFGL